MAKSIEQIEAEVLQIKNETKPKANTATRVGGVMEDIIHYAEETFGKSVYYRGTLGVGGTISELPAPAPSNNGYRYDVITAGTYNGVAAKIGQSFISTGVAWTLVTLEKEGHTPIKGVDYFTDKDKEEFIQEATKDIVNPIVYKGTLGVGGTITTLPTASEDNHGWQYKVITAGTYNGVSANINDSFASNGSQWLHSPSNEDSGLVEELVGKVKGLEHELHKQEYISLPETKINSNGRIEANGEFQTASGYAVSVIHQKASVGAYCVSISTEKSSMICSVALYKTMPQNASNLSLENLVKVIAYESKNKGDNFYAEFEVEEDCYIAFSYYNNAKPQREVKEIVIENVLEKINQNITNFVSVDEIEGKNWLVFNNSTE